MCGVQISGDAVGERGFYAFLCKITGASMVSVDFIDSFGAISMRAQG